MKLFNQKMIAYRDQLVANWKEGIALAAKLLIDHKYVGTKYVDEIVKITEEHGPYYIIAPKIALLHVAPTAEIKANAITFTYFKNPIVFKEDQYYHVTFCLALAAKDNSSHIDILQAVALLFTKQDFLQELQQCNSQVELLNIINKYDL